MYIHLYVLKLLIMLEISLITVKKIREYVSCGILHNLNSTAVNEDIFIKILHLHTYSCKYETATYRKRFVVVDIA